MNKYFLSILIVVSIAASVLVAASNFEKKEPVYIGPWADEFTIAPGQIAVARSGWANCSMGLQEDWLKHTIMTLELYKDGQLIQTVSASNAGKWVQETPNPDMSGHCIHINEISSVRWYFEDLALKKPGIYILHFHIETTAVMTDGFDWNDEAGNPNPDGRMDVYPAQVWQDKDITINVLPKD